jgi:predicted P-loop ATPase
MKDTEQKQDNQEIVPQEKAKITKIQEWLLRSYAFRNNIVTQQLEFKKEDDENFSTFTDKMKTDIVIRLKEMRFSKPKEDLEDLLSSSMIEDYNPIKEYFHNLKFKGFGYIDQMIQCITLDHPEMIIRDKVYKDLFADYFRRWLMACYLCSNGICVNDVMLILIGAQGRYKTSFLNNLCPAPLIEYRVCSHINPSLTDYNTSNYLAEKFLINVDDQMETIFGRDYNCMKAIVSAPDITNRKLYKATHQRRRRIANFCGSVNESRFLRDSNNRRYLCFAITDIDKDYINIDIDAMWAEVKQLAEMLQSKYIFGREDYVTIDMMNAQFEAPTEEAETLQAVFQPVNDELPDDNRSIYYLSFTEILGILKMKSNSPLKPYNLQTAMRKYGYTVKSYKRERFGKQPRNLYAVELVNPHSKASSDVYIHNKMSEYL